MSNNEKKLIVFLIVISLIAVGFFNDLSKEEKIVSAYEKKESQIKKINNDIFDNIQILAKSAYVIDAQSNSVIFEKNSNNVYPLASITKIMTLVSVMEILNQNDEIFIYKDALMQDGDNGLILGDKWGRDELIKLMMVASSNDAAWALASRAGFNLDPARPVEAFVNYMNGKANSLGLSKTYFHNPTGLDIVSTDFTGAKVGLTAPEFSTKAGTEGSARDIAMLLKYAVQKYPDLFEPTQYSEFAFRSLGGKELVVKNTNKSADYFPQIIASKTGMTSLAGGNLAIYMDAGLMNPIVVVVLGSTEDGRFSDALKLAKATTNYLQNYYKLENY